jgi:hypothetical protein
VIELVHDVISLWGQTYTSLRKRISVGKGVGEEHKVLQHVLAGSGTLSGLSHFVLL